MPYEYRKLTSEECEEIVRYRRERGYPLHAPPHPFREAGYYLITAANYEYEDSQGRDWFRAHWKSNPPPEELGRGCDD